MDLQPHLVGETVRLRPMREEDRVALTKAGSDPEIWAQHPEPERYRAEQFARFFEDGLASGGALVIEDNATGGVIGTSRYDNLDLAAGHIEIGWTFLSRAYWGGPTNREVKALMLTHAFETVPVVHFRIGAGNIRSRRAVEKLGAGLAEEVGSDVLYTLNRAAFAPDACGTRPANGPPH